MNITNTLHGLPPARLLCAEPFRQLIARFLTDAHVLRTYGKDDAEFLENVAGLIAATFTEASDRSLYIDTAEAAEILRLSAQQVTYLCRKGKFVDADGRSAAELVGGVWRILRTAVESYRN
jgi:hypothetical protein